MRFKIKLKQDNFLLRLNKLTELFFARWNTVVDKIAKIKKIIKFSYVCRNQKRLKIIKICCNSFDLIQ